MIMIQPPSQGLRSGGYSYNARVASILRRRARGDLLEVRLEDLAESGLAEGFPPTAAVLLDSLYLFLPVPPAEVPWLATRRRRVGMVVHYLPSEDPSVSESERRDGRAREDTWFNALDFFVVTGSRTEASLLRRGVPAAKITLAEPGVGTGFRPAEQPPANGDQTIRLLSVGSVSARKNQCLIARALSELGNAGFRWTVMGSLAAEPEESDRLRRIVGDSGLLERVDLAGPVEEERVAGQLRSTDLFVSASTMEWYGMAVAEAVASGVPVLSFRVGSAADWVTGGENGFLFEPNDPDAFCGCLRSLVTDPEKIEPLLAAARARCARLTFPSWAEVADRVAQA